MPGQLDQEERRLDLPLADRTMALRAFKRQADGGSEAAPFATAELVFTTGSPVRRYDWSYDRAYLEELVVEPDSIRLDRLRSGAPLLDNHDSYELASILGVVDTPAIASGAGTCMAKFSRRPDVAGYVQDVADGIIRSVSVGYVRHRIEMIAPEGDQQLWRYRVTDWEPYEVSLVPIPADPGAQVLRGDRSEHQVATSRDNRTFPCVVIETRAAASRNTAPAAPTVIRSASLSSSGATEMPTTNTDQQAHGQIRELCQRYRVPHLADDMIRRGITVDASRTEIMNELARRDDATGGHLNVRREYGGANSEQDLIVNTLVARMGGRVSGDVIRSCDVVGLAARALEASGQRVSFSDSRTAILERAFAGHTTGDFPNLLGTAVGRVLMEGYETAPAVLKAVARKAPNLPDFRNKTAVRLGPNASLDKVNEHGEFKHGTMQEAANSWKLSTFGRIFSITRQALVNDDLGGFSDLVRKFGESAARREADELVSILTSPPNVDGAALFSAGNKSLLTGAGSALQASSLASAVQNLRLQTDLDGSLVANEPEFLVVPAALETTARQLLATYQPTQASNVQPYKLQLLVEPRLDAISATAWYVAARGQSSLEYGYLDGAEGVQTFLQEGFEIDGLSVKARLDFGCGWVGKLGWLKSAGA